MKPLPRSLLLFFLLLNACAGMTVMSVPTAAEDAKAHGVRYYGTSPYLLVHTDNAGGIVADLRYLPDRSKKMSAQPFNYLASNATTLQFDKGVLTTSSVEVDETVVPSAALAALKDLAIAATKVAGLQQSGTSSPEAPLPVLFKIVVDQDGPHLWGPAGVVSPTTNGIHVQKTKKE